MTTITMEMILNAEEKKLMDHNVLDYESMCQALRRFLGLSEYFDGSVERFVHQLSEQNWKADDKYNLTIHQFNYLTEILDDLRLYDNSISWKLSKDNSREQEKIGVFIMIEIEGRSYNLEIPL